MPSGYRKFRPGDPLNKIPAALLNELIDLTGQSKMANGASGTSHIHRRSCVIDVLNDSGADQDEFHILGIDDSPLVPADDLEEFSLKTPIVTAIEPTADHKGAFCVLLEPILAGEIGKAAVAGVVQCPLSVTAATDRFAEVEAGTVTYLKTGGSGSAQILWKQTGTGSKWGIVRLGNEPQEWHYGKLDAELTAGDSVAMSIWTWDASTSSWVDSGDNITVYAPPLLPTGSIALGTWVQAMYHQQSERWYVTAKEC